MQKYNLQLMFVIDELRVSAAARMVQTERAGGDGGSFCKMASVPCSAPSSWSLRQTFTERLLPVRRCPRRYGRRAKAPRPQRVTELQEELPQTQCWFPKYLAEDTGRRPASEHRCRASWGLSGLVPVPDGGSCRGGLSRAGGLPWRRGRSLIVALPLPFLPGGPQSPHSGRSCTHHPRPLT